MKSAKIVLLYLSVCALWACTDIESLPTASARKEVLVLFSPNGLGDNSYNDQMLRGVVRYANSDNASGVDVDYYCPTSLAEGEQIVAAWCDTTQDKAQRLLVLASSAYKEVVDRQCLEWDLDITHNQVLLFESEHSTVPGISTFGLSMYGAAYMAGAIAGEISYAPLIVLANASDKSIRMAADGFRDGYTACRDDAETVDIVYLSDTDAGYAMADSVYRLMYDWAMYYNFIFPVMGGSNMGVFRYMREYPRGLYTVGTDVDQSHLCNQMVGSMVKHIDRVVEEYLTRWAAGEELPKHMVYGLESGYVDWVPSYNFNGVFDDVLNSVRTEAEEKEGAYMEESNRTRSYY